MSVNLLSASLVFVSIHTPEEATCGVRILQKQWLLAPLVCLYKSEHLIPIRYRALFKPQASVTDDLGVTGALVAVLRACMWHRFQASSSEMFGSSDWDLQNEDTPFKPCSPYGMPMFLRTGRSQARPLLYKLCV